MEETLYAPTQVLEVHAAMMRNARERWSEEDVQAIKPVYTRAEDRWDNETNEYETTAGIRRSSLPVPKIESSEIKTGARCDPSQN